MAKEMPPSELTVYRGINERRINAFAFIVAVATGAGLAFGFALVWWSGIAAFVVSLVGSALLLRVIHHDPRVRRRVMGVMDWITDSRPGPHAKDR